MTDLCNSSRNWRAPGMRPAPLAPRAWRIDGDRAVGIACVAVIVAALMLI
jgi:hypothetical protein